VFSFAQTSRGQRTYAICIRRDPRGRALPQASTANDVHSLTQCDNAMSLGTILLIILVIVLLGGFSGFGGGPFYGTGYYGGGGLGLILVIVLVLVLLGRL
jgi:Protein of unknown function (DUF3309)